MPDGATPTQLGYLGLGVTDVDAWCRFATDVLGLQVLPREPDGTVLARLDAYQYRFVFTESSADDLDLIGWEVSDERALADLASRLEGQSKTYGVIIVIGPNTHAVAADLYATLELDRIQVKGRTEAVTIHTVLGRKDMLSDPTYLALRERHDTMLEAYRGQEWDRAELLVKECREL